MPVPVSEVKEDWAEWGGMGGLVVEGGGGGGKVKLLDMAGTASQEQREREREMLAVKAVIECNVPSRKVWLDCKL